MAVLWRGAIRRISTSDIVITSRPLLMSSCTSLPFRRWSHHPVWRWPTLWRRSTLAGLLYSVPPRSITSPWRSAVTLTMTHRWLQHASRLRLERQEGQAKHDGCVSHAKRCAKRRPMMRLWQPLSLIREHHRRSRGPGVTRADASRIIAIEPRRSDSRMGVGIALSFSTFSPGKRRAPCLSPLP